MGRTIDDTYNSYVENYRCTVNRGASIREVCRYGVDKGHLRLPTPKDAFEELVERVTKAQQKQMSVDEVLQQRYNTNICYLFGDEYHYIKQDKAALEHTDESVHRKRAMAVALMTNAERTVLHWNRTHSDDEQLELPEKDLGPDVRWNLNQSEGQEGTGTND